MTKDDYIRFDPRYALACARLDRAQQALGTGSPKHAGARLQKLDRARLSCSRAFQAAEKRWNRVEQSYVAARFEWKRLLALNESLRQNGNSYPGREQHLANYETNVRTLLAALDLPVTDEKPFVCEFSSVGNPDHSQYHGAGVMSPTVTIAATDLRALVCFQQAYIAVHDLGGGNFRTATVYRAGTAVAEISYNGRVWTPYPFGDPRRKHIDPATGKEHQPAA